jgi:hypothetical protein
MCPLTVISCRDSILRKDAFGAGSCNSGPATASWQYDQVRGVLSVSVNVWPELATVTAWDDFTVSGIPAGTPLTFVAKLDAGFQQCSTGDVTCCFASSSAYVAEGANRASGGLPAVIGCHGLRRNLEIALAHLAGETFRLELAVAAGGSGSASATLSFEDLPVGAVVTSCKGFRLDVTTGVKRASWGKLKTIYR